LESAVLDVPYLGTALNAFFALYIAALMLWGLMGVLRN
jgi:hypothetical protein